MKYFVNKLISISLIAITAIMISIGTACFPSSGGNGGAVADSINFSIPANSNYCKPSLYQEHSGAKRISFYIQFEDNCKYKLNSIDSNDINKGYGFGYGIYPAAHQDNSIRLGWNWKSDTLLLYNYSYLSSVRLSKKLGSFARSKPIYVQEYYQGQDTAWVSVVQGSSAKAAFVVGKGIAAKPGYFLYPYFGGTSKSPQQMNIKVWGVRITY